VKLFKSSDRICDVFAGIGPFAVPAAKKGCFVYANDLNPRSYHYLVHNLRLNKVQDKARAYNLDGREFIRQILNADIGRSASGETAFFHHVVMNLPAIGLEFIDAFCDAFDPATWEGKLPLVHCYAFSRAADYAADVIQRAESILGGPLISPYVHDVRDVAPNKRMLCLSFRLPETACLKRSRPTELDEREQLCSKRPRNENEGSSFSV